MSVINRVIVGNVVTIFVESQSGYSVYGVEDTLPAGAVATNMNEGGSWDSVNNKVKWLFLDTNSRTLSYTVDADPGEYVLGPGIVSFDGVLNFTLGGDDTVNILDISPVDVIISVTNVTESSMRFEWTNVPDVDYYMYEVRRVVDNLAISGGVTGDNFLDVSGLSSNTAYRLDLTVNGGANDGMSYSYSYSTLDSGLPPVPVFINVTDIREDYLRFEWTEVPDFSSYGFSLVRLGDNFLIINGVTGNNFLEVDGLSPNTEYRFDLIISGGANDGMSYSNFVSTLGDLYIDVIFNVNGGSSVSKMEVSQNSYIDAPISIREGYVFTGWYVDESLSVLFDFESTPIVESINLYAGWKGLFRGKVNSPETFVVGSLDSTQNSIEVVDGDKLPDSPNLAVLGFGENSETIYYGNKDGNILYDVVRGFQGNARSWDSGIKISRNFTAYDYDCLLDGYRELQKILIRLVKEDEYDDYGYGN